jgi:hypothetical protein
VIVAIPPTSSEAAADQRLQQFVRLIAPTLPRFVPD